MTVPDGKRVYLDSNIFIYAAEGLSESVDSVRRLFTQIAAESIRAVTSELTLAEVLVKPLQENRADVVAGTNRP